MFFKEIKKYKNYMKNHFETIDGLKNIMEIITDISKNINSAGKIDNNIISHLSNKIDRYIEFLNNDILSFDEVIKSTRILRILYGLFFFLMCTLNIFISTPISTFFIGVLILAAISSYISYKIQSTYNNLFMQNCKDIAEKYPDSPTNAVGVYNPLEDITDIKKELIQNEIFLKNSVVEILKNLSVERKED